MSTAAVKKPATPAAPAKQELPEKYSNLFKKVVKLFEEKQWKKALEKIEEILASHPTHGESIAFKGILLKNTGKSNEGYTCIKDGLKYAMTSPLTWHLYGMMYKADLDYKQAAKCYLTSLRFQENLIVLKELANMQVHLRDYKGFFDSCKKLVEAKPNMKQNWIAYAVAAHLIKNYQYASNLLDAYLKMTQTDSPLTKLEETEVLMYKNQILREAGDYKSALDHLEVIKKQIVDKISWFEAKAEVLLKLGRKKDASEYYFELIRLNTENYDYLGLYQECLDLGNNVDQAKDEQHSKQLLELYDKLAQEFPKSAAIQRIPLNFATGEDFRQRLDKYMRPYIKKTIPSLFSSLKSIYTDKAKTKILEELVFSYLNSIEKNGTFPGEDKKEGPTAWLWIVQFLACHFDKIGELSKAFEYINKAIEHTPTVIESYVYKGRMYKHSGNYQKAFDCIDQARNLDLADRYLNTKAAKYSLKADKIEEAQNLVDLFLKHEKDPDAPTSNFHYMQYMWYENGRGHAYIRQKQYARGLKEFWYVLQHFDEIEEDQFDFHSYCLRKHTLRAYIGLLRFEDTARKQKYYVEAATSMVQAYLDLHSNSSLADIEIDKSDEKRIVQYQKRKRTAEDAEFEKKDEDPFGEKLVKGANYLDEAVKLLKNLETYASDKLETHLLGSQVYLLKSNYSVALNALLKAKELSSQHPDVHKGIIMLLLKLNQEPSKDEAFQTLLAKEVSKLLPSATSTISVDQLKQWNEAFFKENSQSAHALLVYCELLVQFDKSNEKSAAELFAKHFANCKETSVSTLQLLEKRTGQNLLGALPMVQSAMAKRKDL